MDLNTIKSTAGSRKPSKRVGRGIGSGTGKTCGRGHKGLKSRSGGRVMIGFEGGQMPLHRRLPKVGFRSRKALSAAQIRLSELNAIEADVIDLAVLISEGVVKNTTTSAKVFDSGEVTKSVTLKGIGATKGALAKIQAAGGKVES
jgi:large subunit ribosomal protein L15